MNFYEVLAWRTIFTKTMEINDVNTMEIIDNDIRQWSAEEVKEQFGDSLTLLPSNDNIKELQTILRDK